MHEIESLFDPGRFREAQAARRALGRAAELCALGRSENDPHWLYWLNEGEIHGQAGSCYLDLGDSLRALDSLTAASQAYNPEELRTRALLLTRTAIAHIRTGDIEEGCATAHLALSHAEHLQSKRLNEHLTSVVSEFTTAGHAARAQDVIERTAAVTQKEN